MGGGDVSAQPERGRYETEADIAREREIADRLAVAWDVKLEKLDRWQTLDFAATRCGRLLAFVECKRRNCNRSTYPTVIVSLRKHVAAMHYRNALALPSLSWCAGATA
jgi:uncharacterized protein YjaG (DUF416 family)